MPRARKSASPNVRRVRKTRTPKKVKSASPKVRRVRKSAKASKRASKKKVNKWVQFVKSQSQKMGLSFKDALSSQTVKNAYMKTKA